jgi:nucleoside-diphosphate-sugar epimerase
VKALISGDLGFVGRHMAAELIARGWEVSGFDIRRAGPDEGNGYPHWVGDVRGIRSAPGWPERGTVYDLVVHCAYAVGGRAAIEGVPMNLAHNVAADAALFEWALTTGQRRVLYFSSSAAYPFYLQTPHWLAQMGRDAMPLHEGDIDPRGAEEPDANYGWAKLTGERLAAAAAGQGLPVHVVRPFSGYGGDQSLDYPFPALLWKVLQNRGEPIPVWGSAEQVRDWIHIDDVVNGALAVVDADERLPVNLCTGIPTSMDLLVRFMWELARPGEEFPGITVQTDRPMGVFWRVGDPRRQHEIYVPKITLEEGILRALDTLREMVRAGEAA